MKVLAEIKKAFGVDRVTIQNIDGQRLRILSISVNFTGGAGIATEQAAVQAVTPNGTMFLVAMPAPNAAGTLFSAIGSEFNLTPISTTAGVFNYPTTSRLTAALPNVATIDSEVLVVCVSTNTAAYNNLEVTYELELYE